MQPAERCEIEQGERDAPVVAVDHPQAPRQADDDDDGQHDQPDRAIDQHRIGRGLPACAMPLQQP